MILRAALSLLLIIVVADGVLTGGRTVGLLFGSGTVTTQARFTDAPPVTGNTFTAKPDWTPPATSPAKIVNSIGYVDYLSKGGSYQVCASITDDGNPPSGISTVAANLAVAGSVITNNATAEPLTSGSYTCGGASYNYQSGTLSAKPNLSEGSMTFEVTATDAASNLAITPWSVTIDNSGPSPSAFSTTNAGTAGLIESGDSYQVTLSESSIDLDRVLTGWDGSSTAIFVKVQDAGGQGGKDVLWTCSANTADCGGGTGADQLLGDVALSSKDYVTADAVFNATLSWNSGTGHFTVAVGSCVSGCGSVTTGGSSNAKFTPISGSSQGGIRDKAGNDASGTATESGVHF